MVQCEHALRDCALESESQLEKTLRPAVPTCWSKTDELTFPWLIPERKRLCAYTYWCFCRLVVVYQYYCCLLHFMSNPQITGSFEYTVAISDYCKYQSFKDLWLYDRLHELMLQHGVPNNLVICNNKSKGADTELPLNSLLSNSLNNFCVCVCWRFKKCHTVWFSQRNLLFNVM